MGNASRYFSLALQFWQQPVLHAFKGWDKNLSFEKLLPKAAQQSACLEACSNQAILSFPKLPVPCARWWFSLVQFWWFFLPILTAQYLVFCFCMWLYFSLLIGGGISGREGGIAISLGKLRSMLKQDFGVSEGPGRAARRLWGAQEQQKLQLASGVCKPCGLPLRKSWGCLRSLLEIRPIQIGKVP